LQILAPSSSVIANINGGTGGQGVNNGTAGQNGQNGMVHLITI